MSSLAVWVHDHAPRSLKDPHDPRTTVWRVVLAAMGAMPTVALAMIVWAIVADWEGFVSLF